MALYLIFQSKILIFDKDVMVLGCRLTGLETCLEYIFNMLIFIWYRKWLHLAI